MSHAQVGLSQLRFYHMALGCFSSWIKWKERQERRLKLEAPKIESVHSPLHAQTGNDVTRVYYLSVITESNIIKIIVIYTADIAITALLIFIIIYKYSTETYKQA